MVITKNSKELKQVKQLLKTLKIKHRFNWKEPPFGYDGYALVEKNLIVVNTAISDFTFLGFRHKPMSINYFLSVVLHEIGHIISYRQKKYTTYNKGFDFNSVNKKIFSIWAKQALKAERLADSIGNKLMKTHFPQYKYEASYTGSRGRFYIAQLVTLTEHRLLLMGKL